jgi:hypothetical protein
MQAGLQTHRRSSLPLSDGSLPHNILTSQADLAMSSDMKKMRKVIPEEDYQRTLGTVIREQYFPDIPALAQQLALQQRRSVGDAVGAVAIRREARRLEEYRRTLKEAEQAHEADTDEFGLRRTPRPLHQETLTGFHERVVSEDNAAFDRTQKQEKDTLERQRRLQYLAIADDGSDRATTARVDQHHRHHPLVDSPLPLASDLFEPKAALSNKPSLPIENSLFFVPAGTSHSTREDETCKLLMPPPSSRRLPPKRSLAEYLPKSQQQTNIKPQMTRFQPKSMQVSVQELGLDVSSDDGTAASYFSGTDASTDLDAPPRPLAVELQRAKRKREQELQTFVQMTPLVRPEASPITTWGHVGATPLALRTSMISELPAMPMAQASFSLPNPTTREEAAERALTELEARGRKARGQAHRKSSTILKSPGLTAIMRKRDSASVRSSSSFGTALRASYSRPPASAIRSDKEARACKHAHKTTPLANTNTRHRATESSSLGRKAANITDGLLKI